MKYVTINRKVLGNQSVRSIFVAKSHARFFDFQVAANREVLVFCGDNPIVRDFLRMINRLQNETMTWFQQE